MHPSSNMIPDTANTDFAGTEHTLRFQQLNFDDLEMADIAALAETGQTIPSQLHNPDLTMIDVAALAEVGQAFPPQTYNFIDSAKTDVAELAEVDAACVGRVCSQGSISQAPSAQDSSYLGQSYPTSININKQIISPNRSGMMHGHRHGSIHETAASSSKGCHDPSDDGNRPKIGWRCMYCGALNTLSNPRCYRCGA